MNNYNEKDKYFKFDKNEYKDVIKEYISTTRNNKRQMYLIELNKALESKENILILCRNSEDNKIIVNFNEYAKLKEENQILKDGIKEIKRGMVFKKNEHIGFYNALWEYNDEGYNQIKAMLDTLNDKEGE